VKGKKSNLTACCVCGNDIYIPKNGKPTTCHYCKTVQRMADNGHDIIEMYRKESRFR